MPLTEVIILSLFSFVRKICISLRIASNKEDLPEPDLPYIKTKSPFFIVKFIFFKTISVKVVSGSSKGSSNIMKSYKFIFSSVSIFSWDKSC